MKLEKGKFVGGQTGFVDEFNHLVDFASNFKAGDGLEFKESPKGHPIISLTKPKKVAKPVVITCGADSNITITQVELEDRIELQLNVYYV